MSKVDELARVAYDAYGEATGYRNYQGKPMPSFDDLGGTIQHAWHEAAAAVYVRASRDMADRIVAAVAETEDPA